MKIAVITDHIPSIWAHSINTMKMADGFFKLGHEVEVLVVCRAKEDINHLKVKNIHGFYCINHKIRIKFIRDYSPNYLREIRFIGPIMIKLVKFFAKFIPKLDVRLDPENQISKYCKKNNFDLSFCRTTYKTVYYNIINKIPTILDLHGYDIPELSHIIKLVKNKYFLGIMTINYVLEKIFIKMGFPAGKIRSMDNAVDIDRFSKITNDKIILRKKLGLDLAKKIILYSGILSEDRDVDTILKASKLLDYNVFSFYFLGGGLSRNSIKKLQKYLKLNNINSDIKFLGFKSKELIPYYLKSADVLLATFSNRCVSLAYMSPVKVIEYMASKVPFIMTKIGRATELCSDEECLFTEVKNPVDLSEKIKLIINNKNLRDKIVKNAFNKAKMYSLEKRCKVILELYKKVK
ncbi:MAG: glycosyltransferase [Promethearchaeota archaeon]